jgi:XTP/dITP diphosphohydrolase
VKTLVLATQNAKKGKELAELVHGKYLVRTLADVGLASLAIDESADSFPGNARIKVDAVLAALPEGVRRETFAVLGDDSGLAVDMLDGKPGVRSARFAFDHGTGAGDDANNALLLLLLEAVPVEMRTARFVSAVCAVLVETRAHLDAFGTVEGRIARDLVGSGGFGYDPLFLPDEAPGRRMAELSSDEKHAISHRGRAMRALLAKLDTPNVFARVRSGRG